MNKTHQGRVAAVGAAVSVATAASFGSAAWAAAPTGAAPAAHVSSAASASTAVPAAHPAAHPAAVTSFSDVPADNQFHDEIMWLAEQGITTGYPDGTFRPLQSVTREAMAPYLYRAAGSPAYTAPATSHFVDITRSGIFYKEVNWLFDAGISTGWMESGMRWYAPGTYVDRGAVAAFLYRASGSPDYTPPATSPFVDVPTTHQFYKQITWLWDQGITTGWTSEFGSEFRPSAATARDAMAAFLYRWKMGKLVQLQLLSFNDYHGHIQGSDAETGKLKPAWDPEQHSVGGAEYLSSMLTKLREGKKNTLTVAAGDLIGGSPFLSGLFHDEPSVETLNAMKLDISAVGNHEFDEGTDELLRMQNGGCHPTAGCYFPDAPYAGADFQWLAANVKKKSDGTSLLPGTTVRKIGGIKVGFIGMTLEGTGTLVSPEGVSSVDFKDEVLTANQEAGKLRKMGVNAVVVLLHEGGYQVDPQTINSCNGVSAPIDTIARTMTPLVDVIITGHTHQPYICQIPDPLGRNRLVTSAADYGRLITNSNYVLDRKTGDFDRTQSTAANVLVARDAVTADPAETAIIAKWLALAGDLAAQVVGTVATDVTGDSSGNRGIETPMADLIADAILWGTAGPDKGGAQISFMNVGGVRASFLRDSISNGEAPGEITYQEAYNVAPFGNLLVTMDLTGAQIKAVLEEQYQPVPDRGSRPMLALGVSEGFSYTWDETAPQGSRVVAGSMQLNGTPIDLGATYRVSTLNFLQTGGDLFTTFTKGTNITGGPEDLANLVAFLKAHPGITPPADRVSGL